jgi:hypothetical protein
MSNLTGEWVEIKGYPNYTVSNFGQVFSKKYEKILKQDSNRQGYVRVRLTNDEGCKHKFVHRLVFENFGKDWDAKLSVDHIDNNPQNNCIENLRMATNQQQQFNRRVRKNSKLQMKCVEQRSTNCFRARIVIEGKRVLIGHYKTKEEARQAYETKAREIHGQFFCENNNIV